LHIAHQAKELRKMSDKRAVPDSVGSAFLQFVRTMSLAGLCAGAGTFAFAGCTDDSGNGNYHPIDASGAGGVGGAAGGAGGDSGGAGGESGAAGGAAGAAGGAAGAAGGAAGAAGGAAGAAGGAAGRGGAAGGAAGSAAGAGGTG
jgi:hypothetical protein